MDIDPTTFPSRIFARFTAHNQLTADATGQPITMTVQRLSGETYLQQVIPDGESPSISNDCRGQDESQDAKPPVEPPSLESGEESPPSGVDETLFEEIVRTRFNPQRYPELYQSCRTEKAAKAVEARVAADIVNTYRQIKQKQACPIVQSLNRLL